MTETAQRQRIPFPAAQAPRFDPLGGRAGSRLRDRASLRWVDLPPGWTAELLGRDGVPGCIRDQHGRERVAVSWICYSTIAAFVRNEYTEVTADVMWHGPDTHARDVAERGAALVLDEWATPAAMLPHVIERVETFTHLIRVAEQAIDRWQHEQPDHAARKRDDLAECIRKRNAYAALRSTLAHALAHTGQGEQP